MNTFPEIVGEILLPTPIRVETALSRYPVHRLAKHGDCVIDIHEKNEHGELSIKWEVNYPKKPGQPGPLAYKIDTLVINRRIEEAARPIPRVIRLGSLNEICRELGQMDGGKNTNHIKNALRQNAFAAITAKIRYRARDGSERYAQIDDTRYGIVFTGQKLPDGRKADAVYIVLHDFYIEILNNTTTRPLDYDYLKSLPPAAQRFYEILSYQMYAAIKNDRPRAKLVYSDLCTYAPLVRQTDWNIVRPQLAKIHAPHKKSGYIAKIDYEQTVDNEDQPDWIMLYQPGPKARADHRAFTKRSGPVIIDADPIPATSPALAAPQQPALPLAKPEPSPLEAELIGYRITPAKAAELVRQHDAEHIRTMIEYLDYELAKKPCKIDNPAAWLYSAVRDGCSEPKGFTSRAERKRQAEAARQRQQAEDEKRRRDREQADREQKADDYIKRLAPAERTRMEEEALAAASTEARQNYNSPHMAPFRDTLRLIMLRQYVAEKKLGQREAAPSDA